jgi:tetratricopeptide (TPR) repeat protein
MTGSIAPGLSGDDRLDSRDVLAASALVILGLLVFANGLTGQFILDDNNQIVANDLIRVPSRWWTALSSDVWAFQGQREGPSSNYWRPGHVAWMILNVQLFGSSNPIPWHVTGLLAHCTVVVLAYVLQRRLGATVGLAMSIAAIFAIHPTRVESVTWIAGVHDVLCAMWMLAALLTTMRARERTRWRAVYLYAVACMFHVLAISTKEIGVFFGLIVALEHWSAGRLAGMDPRANLRRTILASAPFLFVAGIFLLLRQKVLGTSQIQYDWQPSYSAAVVTMPSVLMFYARQIFLPFQLGWTYPVRVVEAGGMGFWNFYLPLALLGVLLLKARLPRTRLAILGTAILVLTLVPALNIRAFQPDQIVKDRYLYLPLLGVLMLVLPPVWRWCDKTAAGRFGLRIGILLVLAACAVQTFRYNRAWASELSLFEWSTRVDPSSADNWMGYAKALRSAGRIEEARGALERCLSITPLVTGMLLKGELAVEDGRLDDAQQDLRRVIDRYPADVRAYERLAALYEKEGRFEDALGVLAQAREAVPGRYATLTALRAIILVRSGQRTEALQELEQARGRALEEYHPTARMVLFQLGALQYEAGNYAAAEVELREFLRLTEGSSHPTIASARKRALDMLRGRGGGQPG